MAHGMPDWGEYAPLNVGYKSLDNNELAARLGSSTILNREGNIIFEEKFTSSMFRWAENKPSGTQGIRAQNIGFISNYSYQFTILNDYEIGPSISAVIPFNGISTTGLTGIFSLDDHKTEIYASLIIRYSGYKNEFCLLYDTINSKICIKDNNNSWKTILTNIIVDIGSKNWFTMKLVGNPETGKYKKFQFNDMTVDLSNISCYRYSEQGANMLKIVFSTATPLKSYSKCYLDYVVVTQNE